MRCGTSQPKLVLRRGGGPAQHPPRAAKLAHASGSIHHRGGIGNTPAVAPDTAGVAGSGTRLRR